ncbi:MAG: amidohydrolase family protein [Gammaproteobacteria bacterium]|nr:amidohydrolase family protein [Gammaproteobacteria bacterium]
MHTEKNNLHDVVIRNGKIVDGSGAKPFIGDIAIDGGKISLVGKFEGAGKKEIDAKGNLVTPGWVDVHTHYDGQVCWDPYLTPSSWHGVTTVVMGNCGVGFAPVRPGDENFLIQLMEGVEDIPGSALHEGIQWDWETFPEFLNAIEKKDFVMDLGFMMGHGPLRSYVMGYERCQNQVDASETEIDKMSELVTEAIDAGALGFSTSRTILHRDIYGKYVPGTEASSEEMRALAFGVDKAGEGTLEITSDWLDEEIEMSWMKEYVKKSDCGLTFLQTSGDAVKTILFAEEQFLKGKNIRPQFPGRNVGLMFGLESSLHPFIQYPAYKEIADLPLDQKFEIMKDPDFKKKLLSQLPDFESEIKIQLAKNPNNKTREEIAKDVELPTKLTSNYETQFILGTPPNYEPKKEDSIAAVAIDRGISELEVMYDEMIKNNGTNLIYAAFTPYENYKLDFVEQAYGLKSSVAGGSDGGAHCGLICDASMPTTNLSHWARDREAGKKFPLEMLIRKQTKDTAETFGLFDRGEIKAGMLADINIIDFEKLNVSHPKMIHDLPLGGRRLVQDATGYVATIKSGQVISENGTATGALPGNLIRGKQVCDVKSEITKVPLFDRTFRLLFVKAARLIWGLSKKSMKTTIVSEA